MAAKVVDRYDFLHATARRLPDGGMLMLLAPLWTP